jgi:phosphoribosylamine---glycine ligase
MNLLIVDADGVGLDFALRCCAYGHAVKWFIRNHSNGERNRTGDGLIEKVPEWEKWCQWADLIVPTMNTVYLERFDDLKKLNYPIFGPSRLSARLEIERGFGMQMMEKAGIDVPRYKVFQSFDQALDYCAKHDERWVFKTLGSEEDKSLTYVADDCDDMRSQITRWKKLGKKLKGACMLQEYIEGIEMGVSAWCGRDGFLKLRGENFEYKKLMSGGFGPNTGEMGSVLYYTDTSKLAQAVLDPLEKTVTDMGHRGDIDVNCKIDEKGKAWPLEITARLGYPAFWIMNSQHSEPCQWMLDALQGNDTLEASMEAFVGLVIAQPPFPMKGGRRDEETGIPVRGVTKENWDNLHPVELMLGKDGGREMLVTSGQYVMCVTGNAERVGTAARRAYRLAEGIKVPNKMMRDDIGEDLKEKLPQLKAHGYTRVEY